MPVATVTTSSLDCITKLQEWIRTNWVTGGFPRTAIQYGNNSDFVYVDNSVGNRHPPDNGPWMRISIEFGSSTVATHGSDGMNLIKGQVILQIFRPKGEGEGPLMTLAGHAKAMMNRQDIDDIVMLAPVATGVFDDIREGWAQCNVTIPFYFYETS